MYNITVCTSPIINIHINKHMYIENRPVDPTRVCGRIKGYQYGWPGGFEPLLTMPTFVVLVLHVAVQDNTSGHFAAGIAEGRPARYDICPCDSFLLLFYYYLCFTTQTEDQKGRRYIRKMRMIEAVLKDNWH